MSATPRPSWVLPVTEWPAILRRAADMLEPGTTWDLEEVVLVQDRVRLIASRAEELAP